MHKFIVGEVQKLSEGIEEYIENELQEDPIYHSWRITVEWGSFEDKHKFQKEHLGIFADGEQKVLDVRDKKEEK